MALRPRRRCRPCRPPPSCFFFQSSPASSTSGKTRLHLMAFFSSSSVVHTQFAQTSTKHIPSVMPTAAGRALCFKDRCHQKAIAVAMCRLRCSHRTVHRRAADLKRTAAMVQSHQLTGVIAFTHTTTLYNLHRY